MDITLITNKISSDWSRYRNILKTVLTGESNLLSEINGYLLNNQGKQLRPLLSLLSADICGEANTSSYYCAAVAEIIHTATLLHDDVADSGKYRRGKLTVRAVYSPAASVLTGDYWLSKALNILSNNCPHAVLNCYTHAMSELSTGELIQMEKAESLDTSEEDYYNIIGKKTSSLFIAATQSGAISTNASYEKIKAITDFALQLGYAFQIRDDIFDYSPRLKTGKDSGADIAERKITLPLLCAFKKSSLQEKAEIIKKISQIEYNRAEEKTLAPFEKEIISEADAFVVKYNGISDAQIILEQHIRNATQALDIFPHSIAKESLIEIAQYVGDRNI